MFILLKRSLALLPMPLFVVFGFVDLLSPSNICGSSWGAMTVMWFVMAFAHALPWLQWLEQRYYTHKARSV